MFEVPLSRPTTINAGSGPCVGFNTTLTTADALVYDVPAGSVWIRATAFNSGFPATRFVGLRLAAGKVTFSFRPLAVGNALVMHVGDGFVLDLDLEQPVADSSAYSTPPSQVRFDFAGAVVTAFHSETARVSALGLAADLVPKGPVVFGPDSNHVQFACDVTTTAQAAENDETHIGLSGNWEISGVHWVLTSDIIDPLHPAAASDSGFGIVDAGGGLTLSWLGVQSPLALARSTFSVHGGWFD